MASMIRLSKRWLGLLAVIWVLATISLLRDSRPKASNQLTHPNHSAQNLIDPMGIEQAAQMPFQDDNLKKNDPASDPSAIAGSSSLETESLASMETPLSSEIATPTPSMDPELGPSSPEPPIQSLPLPPPLPFVDHEYYWPPRLEDAICRPKIYVYKAPETFQVSDATRQHVCHVSNYNSESILHDRLVNPDDIMHQTYATQDPEEADFFLIPFFGACYLYNCWSENNWDWTNRCDVDELYVKPMMDMVINDYPYWNRSQGRDHIMIHPMDKTFTYYKDNARFQDAIFLTTVGDKRFKFMDRHRYHRDIIIPSATRLLHHVGDDPMSHLTEDGQPKEGVPERNIFALFQGCCSTVNETDLYSNGIRSLLFKYFANYPDYVIGPTLGDEEYIDKLIHAKYGLSPMGWTLDTTRIWEFIAYGVVPVVISDGIIEPFEYDVDWNSFIVRIRREEAHRLDEILRSIDDETYQSKRRNLWEYGRRVGLEKDAWHFIARELCRMANLNRPENLGLGY